MSRPIHDEYDPWATYNPGEPDLVRRNPKRQRKPNFIAMVKRAQRNGLNITGVNVTKDDVVLKLGALKNSDTDVPIHETADDLRKLI